MLTRVICVIHVVIYRHHDNVRIILKTICMVASWTYEWDPHHLLDTCLFQLDNLQRSPLQPVYPKQNHHPQSTPVSFLSEYGRHVIINMIDLRLRRCDIDQPNDQLRESMSFQGLLAEIWGSWQSLPHTLPRLKLGRDPPGNVVYLMTTPSSIGLSA